MIGRTSRALFGLPLVLGLGALLLAQSGPSTSTSDPATREFLQRKLARKIEKAKKNPRPYDQPAEAQEFYVLKRAAPGEKVLHPEKYLGALEHMRRMPRRSTARGEFLPPLADMAGGGGVGALALGSWTALGPGNIGGRTRGLVIDPGTPTTMYAAGVAGGVWKTTDGGASWAPLTDLIANLAVNSLAMDPGNSSVLYAGTGEGYFNGDFVRGAGIFKTTNGGTNWTQLANTNNNVNFHYVNDIIVSHNDSNRVYAATRTGVWRSGDGGTTWTQVLASAIIGGCLDLEIRRDITATDTLFASCGTFTQASIFRNTDAAPGGAGAWTSVYTETNMGRTSLAIAPSAPGTIYALIDHKSSFSLNSPGMLAVIRSTTGGGSGTWSDRWRQTGSNSVLNNLLLTNPVAANLVACSFDVSNIFSNQGWYDNVIAVDPADANRVWAGGIDLFRSDDAGANWGMASHWWAATSNPRFAHADQHAIAFHPGYNGGTNKVMFVGNDGGLFRTNDAQAATATGAMAPCSTLNGSVGWTELNNNYGVTQFYHGVPYPSGATYFGGTQDNGTIRGSDGGAESWTEILGGDGGYVAVDPNNTDILYAENTGLSIQKCTLGLACNDPSDWADATNGISESGANFLFIAPFMMDPSNSSRLWTGGFFMWRTTTGASSWTQASAILAGVESVSAIGIDPNNGNNVISGMSDGFINYTTSGLTSVSTTIWPSVRPRAGFVSSAVIGPTGQGYLTYSTFGGSHVWRSVGPFNSGSWVAIDGTPPNNIPDIPVHSIVVDPSDTQRLFVGTDLGVFSTTDGGANWAVEDTGFAHVVVEALAIGNVGATPNVFAFTHGRGAWRTALPPPGPTLTIDDVTVTEGDAGTVDAVFTVTLAPVAAGDVMVDFATANNTATAGADYNSNSGQVTILAGGSTQTITVQVLGDTTDEPNETFFVNLSNASGADIGDSQGVGTITDDDVPGTFTGKVTNRLTGLPIRGATVEALQGGVVIFSTTTNRRGKFTLGVTAGTYDLRTSKPGFKPKTRLGQAISSGQTIVGVNFKLKPQ